MTEISLLVDEDAMSRPLIRALQSRGVDVATVADTGLAGSSDEKVLEHSGRAGRVLYTFNAAHFCQIHRQWQAAGKNHPGIIIGNQQRFGVGQQLRLLLKLLTVKSSQEMANQVQFLSNWRSA